MARIEIISRKYHWCDMCGFRIQKCELYVYDPFYTKATYDCEFDSTSPGYIKHWRSHLNKSECDKAKYKLMSEL